MQTLGTQLVHPVLSATAGIQNMSSSCATLPWDYYPALQLKVPGSPQGSSLCGGASTEAWGVPDQRAA